MSPSDLLLLLCAPAVGSFAGVLVDRLPRGEDVVRGRSACRSCGITLGSRELVPIWSFARSGGRCRSCGATIPPAWLYLELAALGVGVVALAVTAGQGAGGAWLVAGILWTLMALAATDLAWFRLPDLLTMSLVALALPAATLPGGPGLSDALVGGAVGAGAFWALGAGYRAVRGRTGLGAGDIKLMAGIGALVGPWALPQTVLLAALAGLAGAAWDVRRRGRRALRAARPLPFGATLAVAAGVVWCLALTR
ncbi:prepilin peptidase [Roseivivax marinus]|uniref:prepilin peptidase n=1 Tax=Roseivivax marinus TaxID=1379903 RepID=UPI00273F8B24|nr:A24 family peptidase [Roseivivax marinus]